MKNKSLLLLGAYLIGSGIFTAYKTLEWLLIMILG